MVYKALMDHKRAKMQKLSALASDTRTITEAMLRKQVFVACLASLFLGRAQRVQTTD